MDFLTFHRPRYERFGCTDRIFQENLSYPVSRLSTAFGQRPCSSRLLQRKGWSSPLEFRDGLWNFGLYRRNGPGSDGLQQISMDLSTWSAHNLPQCAFETSQKILQQKSMTDQFIRSKITRLTCSLNAAHAESTSYLKRGTLGFSFISAWRAYISTLNAWASSKW